jgi:integrase
MPKRAARKLQLTELTLRKSKPERAAYLLWDLRQHGLALRVQPTGARSWVVIYRHHGRPRWFHLGNGNAIALSDARKLAQRVALAVAEGKDPAAEKRAERGAGTFADLAERYLEQHAKRHNKSWAQPDRLLRRYVLPRWGKLQAASIVRADVKALMAGIEAPKLANQVLAAASAIFSWAQKEEIVGSNPCRGVDRNPTSSRERVLSDSEVPLFWSAFDAAGPIVAAALKVLLLTGQRPGEVAHMRREHIVDDGWWQMLGDPVPELGWLGTKNGASHRVWLPKAAQQIIADGDAGFVFADERGNAVGRLDGAMRDICVKLKVERATPHDLRRTHGSTITALGFGRDAMNRVQNHVEGGIASVYDRHQYASENQKIMEAVANKIMTLIEGTPTGKVVPIRR